LKVIVLPHVWPDLLSSAEWYELGQAGLSGRFLTQVDDTLLLLQDLPARFPLIYRDARRAQLKHFPFGIFFVIRNDAILMFSITHMRRNPAMWRRRIPKRGGPGKFRA
jgi:hypothetical protein